MNQTPLPEKNEIHSDLKPGLALPIPLTPIPNDKPLGVGTEAGNLLIRFNPRLVGFGIIGPSPGLGLKDKNRRNSHE
jgi:hypothetical protein